MMPITSAEMVKVTPEIVSLSLLILVAKVLVNLSLKPSSSMFWQETRQLASWNDFLRNGEAMIYYTLVG